MSGSRGWTEDGLALRKSTAQVVLAMLVGLACAGTVRAQVYTRLGPNGVEVETGTPRGDKKKRPEIIERVWRDYGTLISDASARHGVPAELLVAIIVEESSGRPGRTESER